MGITRIVTGTGILLTCLALTACGRNSEPHILHSYGLGQGTALVTDAKQRVVWSVPAENGQLERGGAPADKRRDPDYGLVGHNEPNQIICAEPSPDVTQAISEAMRLAVSVDLSKATPAGMATGGGKDIGVDFGRSVTAAVAQLGERLASIQLLRDKMYRACEAYANGAINATTYTTTMGRIDKTMVTLLSAELAAGAFGRELAALGGTASVKGPDPAVLEEKRKAVEAAQKALKTSQDTLNAKIDSLKNEADPATKAQPEIADVSKKRDELEKAILAYTTAAETTLSLAAASTIGKVTGLQTASAKGSSDAVVAIHRAYVDDDGLDAMVDACITALDYTGPLYARLIARHTFYNYEPYFDALKATTAARIQQGAHDPTRQASLLRQLASAQAEEGRLRAQLDVARKGQAVAANELKAATEHLSNEKAFLARLGRPDEADPVQRDAQARIRMAERRYSAAVTAEDKAGDGVAAAQDRLLNQTTITAGLHQTIESAAVPGYPEIAGMLQPLLVASDDLQDRLLKRVKTGIDNRLPMMAQCKEIIGRDFAGAKHSQEQSLRGTGDPNEIARLGARSQAEAMTACADKALAIAGNAQLATLAPEFLKSCIAQSSQPKAPAAKPDGKAAAKPSEAPLAAPRLPVTRIAFD
ncbi:hypothetical protein [Ferrovibrio terrae]|uniref:hypothetical protein n=1 Tax=Ferrovibrio terrae TaxID=2594003 RepID=UPI003137F37E